MAVHQLGNLAWHRTIRITQSAQQPRNQQLRVAWNCALRPVKHFAHLIEGAPEVAPAHRDFFFSAVTYLRAAKCLPDFANFDCTPANIHYDDHVQVGLIVGFAMASHIFALQDFKHHWVPTTVAHGMHQQEVANPSANATEPL